MRLIKDSKPVVLNTAPNNPKTRDMTPIRAKTPNNLGKTLTAPVNINNVVNIVNNNYNNIIPPQKVVSRNHQGQIKNVSLYSNGPYSKEQTERKSMSNTALQSIDPSKVQNMVLDKAINNISNYTEESFDIVNYQSNIYPNNNPNNYFKPKDMVNYKSSIYENLNDKSKGKSIHKKMMRSYDIPSEDDKIRYERGNGNQRSITVGRNDKLFDSQTGKAQGTYSEGPVTDERKDEMNNYVNNHLASNASNDFNALSGKDYSNYEFIPYPKKNIFAKNDIYNLSNRFINDESRHHHSFQHNPNYKFIEKIREDKLKQANFDKKWFWRLNDNAIYVLVSFLSNQYEDLLRANKSLGTKLCLSLNNKFEGMIGVFREKYKEVLELQEFYFKQTNFKKGKTTCK
jgi:hypothetical protein